MHTNGLPTNERIPADIPQQNIEVDIQQTSHDIAMLRFSIHEAKENLMRQLHHYYWRIQSRENALREALQRIQLTKEAEASASRNIQVHIRWIETFQGFIENARGVYAGQRRNLEDAIAARVLRLKLLRREKEKLRIQKPKPQPQ